MILRNTTILVLLILIGIHSVFGQHIINEDESPPEYAIVIHGGAGNFTNEDLTPDEEEDYTKNLLAAIKIGAEILKNGGSAMDAVEQTIIYLENCPLFNAGKGAVFTHEGKNELDASVMDGKTGNAGAVAGVTNIKNPVSAARKVMTNSKHVMLSGDGAAEFAKDQGLEIVDSSYFFTQKRWKALQQRLEKEGKNGTVGCVALDKNGNLAAGTSTGGMTNKQWGRIGDSPIIGAGTYADNKTCGVSATGHGEFFIRYVVSYDISALLKYKVLSLKEATEEVINNKLKEVGGSGGIISIDKNGNISIAFNTTGMFRAWQKPGEESKVLLYN